MVDEDLEYEAKLIEVELRAALQKVDPNYKWEGVNAGDEIPPVFLKGREIHVDLVHDANDGWTFIVCSEDLEPEKCVFYQHRRRFAYSKIAKVLMQAAKAAKNKNVRAPQTQEEQTAFLRTLGLSHLGDCLEIHPAENGRVNLQIRANMPVDHARELLATCHKIGMVRTEAEVQEERLRWN